MKCQSYGFTEAARTLYEDLVVVRHRLFDVPDFKNVWWTVAGIDNGFHVRFSRLDRFLFLGGQGVENKPPSSRMIMRKP